MNYGPNNPPPFEDREGPIRAVKALEREPKRTTPTLHSRRHDRSCRHVRRLRSRLLWCRFLRGGRPVVNPSGALVAATGRAAVTGLYAAGAVLAAAYLWWFAARCVAAHRRTPEAPEKSPHWPTGGTQ